MFWPSRTRFDEPRPLTRDSKWSSSVCSAPSARSSAGRRLERGVRARGHRAQLRGGRRRDAPERPRCVKNAALAGRVFVRARRAAAYYGDRGLRRQARDSVTPNTAESNDPDAREQLARGLGFLRRALRSWPIVLCTLLVGGLGCGVFLYLNKPRYRSETVIFYTEKGSAAEGAEPTATRAVTIRLKELLLSRPTLERVIMKFDPYPELRRTQGMIEALDELKKHIDFR